MGYWHIRTVPSMRVSGDVDASVVKANSLSNLEMWYWECGRRESLKPPLLSHSGLSLHGETRTCKQTLEVPNLIACTDYLSKTCG